jgi:exodeoxyribonuclease VII large subunit
MTAAEIGQPPSPPKPLSVTQLTRRVKELLESQVGQVSVEGELSNWRLSPAGHAYFVLKDQNATISCVLFRSALARVRFEPRDGQQLVIDGRVSVYEARGQYQIIVDRMSEAGLGLLFQRFNELKAKLEAEGLFAEERKKPLPMLPRCVGIVTSPTGAALRDILNVLGRRFANLRVVLAPARVQGAEAAGEIVAAIERFNRHAADDPSGSLADVLIVGRGGGSIEDLWAFNEEAVARAIAASRIPIVSAVGHETDFTIADFVADLRAPTPSAAAELVVSDREELAGRIEGLARRLNQTMIARVDTARLRLEGLVDSYAMRSPLDRLNQARQRLDDLAGRLDGLLREAVREARGRFEASRGRFAALDPKAVLARGYSIVTRARTGRVIVRADQVRTHEHLRVELSEGRLRAVVVPDQADFLDGKT